MVPEAVNAFTTRWSAAISIALWSVVILGAGMSVAAETETTVPSFVVKSWRTIDGLPQNSVTALAQTSDGYLWVGTRGGLARFDGVRFRNYILADGLKGVAINTLVEDGQGGLWIGTQGGGLSRWRSGTISTLTTADGLAHNDVMALAAAEAGAVWVGTKRGLQHWGADGFTQVGAAEGLRNEVLAMASDSKGGVWVTVLSAGLFHCKEGRCQPVEGLPVRPPIHGYSLLVDTEGDLWMSIGNGKVLRRHAEEWTVFNESHGLPFNFVRQLAQGNPGEIWAASPDAGLYVFREGRFHAVPALESGIRSVHMSRDGIIWAGTPADGLCRLTPRRLGVHLVALKDQRKLVTGLVEQPPGEFWIGIYGGGLHHGSLDRLQRVLGVPLLDDFPHLTAGLRMNDGTVYFGGVALLLRREPATGEIHCLTPTNNITALCGGADRALWLGTREGTVLRLVNQVPQPVTNGIFGAVISGLVRGSGPALWVATQGAGLFRWDAGRVQRWTTAEGLPTDVLRTLHYDNEGTLWIGTAGGGLAWLEGGRLRSLNSRQGLGDDVISQILEDDRGNLWLGCNRGIFRVSKRELRDAASGRAAVVHPLALDESDGMLTAECSGGYSPAGLRGQSGTLYFSTSRGVVAVDPTQFGPASGPPTVLVEDVTLEGKPILLSGAALALPPGSRELEIRYTAFNYAKPEQIRFRHRLEGRNQEWVEMEGARSVRFSHLPPGDYVFQVSAANQDHRWHETGTRLPFRVQPYLWQTRSFKALGLAAFLVLVYGIYHRRMVRLKQEHAAQQAFARQLILSQENERKRVAAELHDGLGQNLLLIKNRLAMATARQADTAELTHQLDAATAATTRAIGEVRTISHALRPAALEQVGLTKAIEWMVEQLGEGSATKFSTEMHNIDGLLSPEMEMNLFRIIQEGLANIIRHAGAAQVVLEVKREETGLCVSLFDNGRGFDTEKLRTEPEGRPGLGLASMAERAKYLGGSLDLQSASGRGTRVTVRIPLLPTKF